MLSIGGRVQFSRFDCDLSLLSPLNCAIPSSRSKTPIPRFKHPTSRIRAASPAATVATMSPRGSCLMLSFRAFNRFPRRTPIRLPFVCAIVELAPHAVHTGAAKLLQFACKHLIHVQRVTSSGNEGERFGFSRWWFTHGQELRLTRLLMSRLGFILLLNNK